MKPLLPINHPTYLRRLARELSHRPAGFYHAGLRWNRASFSPLTGLTIWRVDEYLGDGRRREASKNFKEVTQFPSPFDDGNGREICASRT